MFIVVTMSASVVKLVEELATMDEQFDGDITFEDRGNISIEDADNTTKDNATAGLEL